MKSIPLTHGKFTVVDDADYGWLNQFKWYAARYFKNGKELWYAQRGCKNEVTGKPTTVQMQRLILGVVGQGHSVEVDHGDGDGLNNRRYNLRAATHAQNCQNTRMSRRNSSGYKGVSFHKVIGKYKASISVNKTRLHLGWHDTAELASEAYKAAALQHHAEFARQESFRVSA